MDLIIQAAIVVGIIAWFSISTIVAFKGVEIFVEDFSISGIVIGLLGVVSLILCVAVFTNLADSSDSNEEHCGPGTEYRESRHYNPSTRNMHTDWWCEAK